MSLRQRLLVALLPLFLGGLLAADVVTYTSLQSFLLDRVDQQLAGARDPIEHQLLDQAFGGGGNGFNGGGPPGGGDHGPVASIPPGSFAQLRSSSGAVVLSDNYTFVNTTGQPVLPSRIDTGSTGSVTFTASGTGAISQYRVLAVNSIDAPGDVVAIAIPLDDVTSTLRRLLLLEVLITAAVTVIVLVAMWLLIRRSLRPLERMATTARGIVVSDLSRRVAPATERTEVGRLGVALNTMLSQLEGAFAERRRSEERLRQFVSDASHELRTPLTSMRGYAELFRRNPSMPRDDIALAMRRIEDESDRMSGLVDDLLVLARLDQGPALLHEPVDLQRLVRDACVDARAADPSRTVTARAKQPLEVIGDEPRLRQVVGNLVRNALVHTPPGTPVEIACRREGERAVVEVIDHGRGIPAAARDRIFERFHRADPARSRDRGGSGLGLSIVAAVMHALGGSVTVRDTPGGGATFRLELPLGAPRVAVPAHSQEARRNP